MTDTQVASLTKPVVAAVCMYRKEATGLLDFMIKGDLADVIKHMRNARAMSYDVELKGINCPAKIDEAIQLLRVLGETFAADHHFPEKTDEASR